MGKFFLEMLDTVRQQGHATVGNGPLAYYDPKGRFTLSSQGFWHGMPIPDLPNTAGFAEMQKQFVMTLHVREVSPDTPVQRAAKEGESRFQSLKGWNAWKESRPLTGAVLREKTTYLRDQMITETSIAVEILHAVIGGAHVMLVLRTDPEEANIIEEASALLAQTLASPMMGGISGQPPLAGQPYSNMPSGIPMSGMPQTGIPQGNIPSGIPQPGMPQAGIPSNQPFPNLGQPNTGIPMGSGMYPPQSQAGNIPIGSGIPSAPNNPMQPPMGGIPQSQGFPPQQGGFSHQSNIGGIPQNTSGIPMGSGMPNSPLQGQPPLGVPPIQPPMGVPQPPVSMQPSVPHQPPLAPQQYQPPLTTPQPPVAPMPTHTHTAAASDAELPVLSFIPLSVSLPLPSDCQLLSLSRDHASVISSTQPGLLVLYAGLQADASVIANVVLRLMNERGYSVSLQGAPQNEAAHHGARVVAAHFQGKDGYGAAISGAIKILFGANGNVLAAGAFGQLSQRVDAIVRSARLGKIFPDARQAQELIGNWGATQTQGARSTYSFMQDGTYRYQKGQGGQQSGNVLGALFNAIAGAQNEDGRYYVSHGSIVLLSAQGSRVVSLRKDPQQLFLNNEAFVKV